MAANIKRAVDLALALERLQAYSLALDPKEAATSGKLRASTFDKKFPTVYSFHGLDLLPLIDSAVNDKVINGDEAKIVLDGMYKAINSIGESGGTSKGFPILTENVWNDIQNAINKFINVASNKQASNAEVLAEYKNIQKLFAKPYLVSFINTEAAKKAYNSEHAQPSIKVVHNSFANFRTTINNKIKKAISDLLNQSGASEESKNKLLTIVTSKILNWGHTRTSENSIITGKLMSSLINFSKTNINLPNENSEFYSIVAKDFIVETGQISTKITLSKADLTKGNTNVLRLVLDSQLQTVLAQYSKYNQGYLGKLEDRWKLSEAFRRNAEEIKKILNIDAATFKDLIDQLVSMNASPSLRDDIETLLAATLKGVTPGISGYTKPIGKVSTPIKAKQRRVSIKGKKSNSPGPDITKVKQVSNLVELQALLDRMLVQQVASNMGTGNRKDVLNYRTGRFAESVKVEKLSESRQGMITAFYSYMKYPYATFSQGGRQQNPRSRDPKTLISQSIRELARTLVTNRLRAVNV